MAIRLGCVCVAGADGAVRACGRAYARCEERWKVRMGIARNTGNGGKQKKKTLCGGMNAEGLVELTVVETATSSMRTKRSTN